jgi:ABC-2 type transport system ATP-binding protein
MLTATGLTKDFGSLRAVDTLDFEVRRGEVLGFLGVNGAGKTTTLRMLAGILQPSSGDIFVGGSDLRLDPKSAKSKIGFIPDRPHLYGKLTTTEFLHFIADLYNFPQTKTKEQADCLLEEFGLIDMKSSLIEELSHGMRQRLTMCAALIHEPEYLIIDEPMVGLDPHGAEMLKKRIRIYAEAGIGILLSTHSLNVAQQIADRFLILERGKIRAGGTLAELRNLTDKNNAHNLEDLFLLLTKGPSTEEIRIDN